MNKKLTILGLCLAAAFQAAAVQVKISVQGSNIVLRWPSQNNQTFIIGYRAALDAANPWALLQTNYPASSSNETSYVVTNVVPLQSFSGGGGGGFTGGPPGPNSATQASGESTNDGTSAKRVPAEIPDFIYPPALQKEPEKWAARSRSVSPASASGESANSLESVTVSSGFFMVGEYGEDSDGDQMPNAFELAFANPFLVDSDNDGITDAAEDADGDGFNNFDEFIWGTGATVADNDYPLTPVAFGDAYSGEVTLTYTPQPGFDDLVEGVYLSADDLTAGGMVLTKPTAGTLKIQYHTIYLGPAEFSTLAAAAGGNDPFNYVPTEQERQLIRAANGETDISLGKIGQINQSVYDQMPEHLLDHLAEKSAHGLKRTEKVLQEIESGQRQASEAFRRALAANLVTQRSRLAAATGSLFRRFGRAVNRFLPFLGGIMIIANSSQITADFQDAMESYVHDIRNGDDTTGSVAILAGHCNDLAPGSGNIVIEYLLR